MLLIFAVVFLLRRYGTYAAPLSGLPTETSGASLNFDTSIFSRDDSTTSDGRHRTVLDILWSCLATTFACTWVSVHPNVPWKGEGKWTILGRRIYLMFFSILAPEFMVMWAFMQWRGARVITETMNDSINKAYLCRETRKTKLWTTTHGHLLQMGGFRLCATARENFYWGGSIAIGRRGESPNEVEEQHHLYTYISEIRRRCESVNVFIWSHEYYSAHWATLANVMSESDFYKREAHSMLGITQSYEDVGVDSDELIWESALRIDALKKLLAEGLIQLPIITAEEIGDRSKGDAVSKGLALLQLTWFVVQIITRAARGLAISELELTTAALAGMNSVMYLFWWSKPRDVRFPVAVRTKRVEKLLAERPVDNVDWELSDEDDFDFREHLWASVKEAWSFIVSLPFRVMSTFLKLLQWIKTIPRRIKDVITKILMSLRGERQGTVRTSVPPMGDPDTSDEDPDVQKGRREPSNRNCLTVSGRLLRTCWPWWFAHKLKSVAICMLKHAALPFFLLLYLVDLVFVIPIAQILRDSGNTTLSGFTHSDFDIKSKCRTFRMMFYSEDAQTRPLLATSSIAGALFGAVHCLAWRFSFPSHAEQIMWRSASVGLVGSCVVSLSGVIIWPISENLDGRSWRIWNRAQRALTGMISVVYPIARIALLVLAVASLRSLPSSTLDTIDWVELFPHI